MITRNHWLAAAILAALVCGASFGEEAEGQEREGGGFSAACCVVALRVTTYETTPAWDPRGIGCTRPGG